MSELVQFVVLQRSEKWVVKSRELERAFGDRRKAIHCAVELANESGKNGKPALVLAGSRRHEFAPIWTFGKDPYPLARSVSRRLAKIERPKIGRPKIGRPKIDRPKIDRPKIDRPAPVEYRPRLTGDGGSLHDSWQGRKVPLTVNASCTGVASWPGEILSRKNSPNTGKGSV